MSWIAFKGPTRIEGQKTLRWMVTTVDETQYLGLVSWYPPWRRYCFTPGQGTVFEQDCLREIATFCETKTREHKAARKVA